MKRRSIFSLVISLAMARVGCAGPRDDRAGQVPPPPRAVTVTMLRSVQVRDTSEHLAQIVSRHHVAVFPQVMGRVAAIFSTPGARVRRGDPLLQIDARKEMAVLAKEVAAKGQRQASLTLALANERRSKNLLAEALTSRAQYEQDTSEREAEEQALKAQEAAIDAQRAQVDFYRVTAPFDGIVGDIPVKVGDSVTPQTRLTSLDDNGTLEARVSVPPPELALLGERTRIELLTPGREPLRDLAALPALRTLTGEPHRLAPILAAPVSFVAASASPDTQAVLVKASFRNYKALRDGELVRARVVWGSHPGLTVPSSAVLRELESTYVYVVDSDGGASVARRRPVTLGGVDDSHFAVLKGLREGDRLITSQLQKLHDGDAVVPSELQPTAGR